MPKKKVDARVRALLERGERTNTRSLLVVVGDRGRDQVVNMHYLMSKLRAKRRPSVLWCYNKSLGFSTHKQKRMKEIKKKMRSGVWDPDRDNPFELFVTSADVRWCYYKDTSRVLGQTFGMCVLQDFEAVTPNILCRTLETVEGGGCVMLLLRTMDSLRQLYTMAMDVHDRFRTGAHGDVVARFNERFLLSLADCEHSLVVDDEMNVLPISRHARELLRREMEERGTSEEVVAEAALERSRQLSALQEKMAGAEVVGKLVEVAKTADQGKALLTFAEGIAEKTLRSTVALTAGRGRGKSACLGLAVAAAVGFGYANIFVTAPHPDNLKTFFEFVHKGLDALAYREHTDFETVASTDPDSRGCVVRINVFRAHRQTIQYFQPQDARLLGPAELVVVDEAAAIPLPLVRAMLGPYLLFLSSTVNGYEGTGRSLSLKLIRELREQQASRDTKGRVLREIELTEPIRYAEGDPIEAWLNRLLCLDATSKPYRLQSALPPKEACDLFCVDRDALFSYHSLAEKFLQRMMSLYVSSHYKNSPNDLQLMSDAPAHRLFALLGPASGDSELPDVLCVAQVCLEGAISADAVRASLARGKRASGDLIPWTLSQQYQDDEFPSLSGARVVRIATHPDAQGMGYGSRTIELLQAYFEGRMVSADASDDAEDDHQRHHREKHSKKDDPLETSTSNKLLEEEIAPRKELPPLLVALADRRPERLHYLGVSFGATRRLHNFWRRGGFTPLYLRQSANELTAEHTCVMIRPLACQDMAEAPAQGWIHAFAADFARRFSVLVGTAFSHLDAVLAQDLLEAAVEASGEVAPLASEEVKAFFTAHDLRRLESYARNLVDHQLVADLVPSAARLAFLGRIPDVRFSRVQGTVVLSMGLQHRTVEQIATELGAPVPQLLAMFNKAIRKISNALATVYPADKPGDDAAIGVKRRESLLSGRGAAIVANDVPKELESFAVRGTDQDWDKALKRASKTGRAPATITVASAGDKRPRPDEEEDTDGNVFLSSKPKKEGSAKKKKKDSKKHKKHKKSE